MDNNTGMGALSEVAYGDEGAPIGPEVLSGALGSVLKPEDSDRMNDEAFWGAAGDQKQNPNGNLLTGLASGLRGQSEMEMAQQKLRAAYIPLIMQSIIQRQQMTLTAAKNMRDYRAQLNPAFDKHMGSLLANGQPIDYGTAMRHALDFGATNGVPRSMQMDFLQSIPRDPQQLQDYIRQRAVASAGTDKALASPATNAAGQQTIVAPNQGPTGRISLPGATPPAALSAPGAPGAGGTGAPQLDEVGDPISSRPDLMAGSNPTKQSVEMSMAGKEPLMKTGEQYANETQTMHDIVSRMTEVRKLQQEVQTGRFAGTATSAAAVAKDIATRFGADPARATELANRIVGAKPGSPNALAAQQAIGQFGIQETLAQLRDSVGPNNRINQRELMPFLAKVDASKNDPASFDTMYDYMRQRYGNYTNRLTNFGGYLTNQGIGANPYSEAAQYHQNEAKTLLGEKPMNTVGPGPVKEPTPVSQLNQAPGRAAPPGQPPVAGAILSPSGKWMVKDPKAKNGYRYVR